MILIDNHFVPDKPFFVAVSGGVDSIAGLDILRRMNPGKVSIFHYNHNTRGQNFLMEEVVRDYSEKYNLPFVSMVRERGRVDTEHAMRHDRFDAFKTLRSDIVLCHHLDDAVESYIMRTIQGNPEYIPIPQETRFTESSNKIVRPFLRTRKSDFKEYAKNNDLLKYVVQDETNQDPTYCRRNYIRHTVLPLFHDMGLPKVVLKKFYL